MESSSLPRGLSHSLRQQAALLRLVRVMGLVAHAAVVAWADALLASEPAHEGFAELALADPTRWKEALAMLGRLSAGADRDLARRQALGILWRHLRAGTLSAAEVVRALHAYEASEREQLTDIQRSEIAVLDDHAHLWPPGLADALDRYLAVNADEGADLNVPDGPARLSIVNPPGHGPCVKPGHDDGGSGARTTVSG